MGVGCLSKPLLGFIRRHLGVMVHPQSAPSETKDQRTSNCLTQAVGQSSTIELSVVVHQSQTTHVSSTVTAFPDKSSSQNDCDKPKRKDTCFQRATTAGLRHSWNGTTKQRNKSPRGSKMSLAFGRAPSAASDTGSMAGFVNGFYALANLTAYESNIVPGIWRSCLTNNNYYCDHVLGRLFNRHPELEEMFDGGVLSCPLTGAALEPNDTQRIIKKKARHLSAFLHRLIIKHQLDYDKMLAECDNLGRTHAPYFYERGLQSCHWDSLAHCIVQEHKKTHMNCDLNMDEKELQQLSWTHFASAVISAVKEAFEDEIYAMPAPPPTTIADHVLTA